MRNYEAMVVLNPTISKEDQSTLLENLKNVITKNGAEVEKVDEMGKRKLAYDINKQKEGFYVLVTFSAEKEVNTLSELERFCKFNEMVLRHIIVRVPEIKKSKKKIKKEAKEAKKVQGKAAETAEGGEKSSIEPKVEEQPSQEADTAKGEHSSKEEDSKVAK